MKNICLFFHLDLPLQLNDYNFFDIGSSKPYFNEQQTEQFIQEYAKKCLIPVHAKIVETINRTYGNFKIILSISGGSIFLLKKYVPEVISSISDIVKTGNIEFSSTTYLESYASIFDASEFQIQLKKHTQILRQTFHQKPVTFRNTDLIFSDEIAQILNTADIKSVMTVNHSQNEKETSNEKLYQSHTAADFSIFFKNKEISKQVSDQVSSNNLNANQIVNEIANSEGLTCIDINYSDFINQNENCFENINFILDFGREVLKNPLTFFKTTSDILKTENAFQQRSFPMPISFKTQLRNSEPDFLNDLQFDALKKLYSMKRSVQKSKRNDLIEIWNNLQHISHFDQMLTNNSKSNLYRNFSISNKSAHEAYLNYMNILNDFEIQLTST